MTIQRSSSPGQALSNELLSLQSQFSNNIIENVNVWLNVLDRDFNIVLWNATAEKLSGYSRQEVLGHAKIWEWLYPSVTYRNQIFSEVTAMLVQGKELENFETQIRCKSGESKTISWNSKGLRDEWGRIYGGITFGYDITDRRRAREALQKAHNELSVLYEITSVSSASIDLDTILGRSLDRVLKTMHCRKGMVHLLESNADSLFMAAHQGLAPSVASQIQLVSIQGDLIGRVLRQGEPLMVPDLASQLQNLRAIPANLLHSYLGVPMRAKGNTLGVFSILGKAGRRFSKEEIALLSSIADQVGVAVENARLYQQARQLAVMEERQRLARDLHDSVTQSLYSLTLFAETSRRQVERDDLASAEWYLQRLSETAQHALKEMRLLVYELRPLALERDGLIHTLQKRLDAVERRAGVKAHLLADALTELPFDIEKELFLIIQEALNNAIKHAFATNVTVEIQTTDDQVLARISDNGHGFECVAGQDEGGIGLSSMCERAESLGGETVIESEVGKGTQILVTLPLNHQDKKTPTVT